MGGDIQSISAASAARAKTLSDALGTRLATGIGNCVAVRDRVRTAIVVVVHNFRIAVFYYAKRGSSAEETN